ncbi:MAG: EB domain-containing protein [Candidatus Pacearchaeota archaeon]
MDKKAQVWVETVIYTLIFLTLIGISLAIVVPVVEKQKDKNTIQNTVNSLNDFDSTILNIKRAGIGNVREIRFNLGEGKFIIDGKNNSLIFEILESSYPYSEPGISVRLVGTNIKSETKKNGRKYNIKLTLPYDGSANITINDKDEIKEYFPASVPYVFFIENRGKVPFGDCFSDPDQCPAGSTCFNGQCVPDNTVINIYER